MLKSLFQGTFSNGTTVTLTAPRGTGHLDLRVKRADGSGDPVYPPAPAPGEAFTVDAAATTVAVALRAIGESAVLMRGGEQDVLPSAEPERPEPGRIEGILNLLTQDFTLVSPEGDVLAVVPRSGTVAVAVPRPAHPAGEPGIDGIPVVAYAPPERVDGLPLGEDTPRPIIVSAIVADAMRQLGLRHGAGVFSPQRLIFRDGKPLGSPGLVRHRDLEG